MQQLQDLIRERVPELNKLVHGCRITFSTPGDFERYEDSLYDKDKKTFIGYGEWTIDYRDHSSRNETYYHEISKGHGGYHSYKQITVKSLERMIELGKAQIIGHPILPHHWLPLLGGDYALDGLGYFMKLGDRGWETCFYDNRDHVQYIFKESFEDQDESFHNFLIENIK